MSKIEQMYTVREVADLLRVGKQAVWKWMRYGKLGYVLVGSEKRVPASALQRFIREPEPISRRKDTAEAA